jgi:hypothetical protein
MANTGVRHSCSPHRDGEHGCLTLVFTAAVVGAGA